MVSMVAFPWTLQSSIATRCVEKEQRYFLELVPCEANKNLLSQKNILLKNVLLLEFLTPELAIFDALKGRKKQQLRIERGRYTRQRTRRDDGVLVKILKIPGDRARLWHSKLGCRAWFSRRLGWPSRARNYTTPLKFHEGLAAGASCNLLR